MTWLNSASRGQPDPATRRRMASYLDLEAQLGMAGAQAAVADELDGVREPAAALIGAEAAEVGFVARTFEPWARHVLGLVRGGGRVVVAPHEWGENVRFLRDLADPLGLTVEVAASPDPEDWLLEGAVAAFVPLVSAIDGHRYPVEAIGTKARAAGVPLVVDAAQAVGQVPVDVATLGCDALFATTRKWVRGPAQTGLAWLREPGAARALEANDVNAALRLGQGVALRRAVERLEAVGATAARRFEMARGLGLTPTGGETAHLTFAIPQDAASALAGALEGAGMHVSWPDRTTFEPLSPPDADGARPLRLTPHLDVEDAQVEAALTMVAEALA